MDAMRREAGPSGIDRASSTYFPLTALGERRQPPPSEAFGAARFETTEGLPGAAVMIDSTLHGQAGDKTPNQRRHFAQNRPAPFYRDEALTSPEAFYRRHERGDDFAAASQVNLEEAKRSYAAHKNRTGIGSQGLKWAEPAQAPTGGEALAKLRARLEAAGGARAAIDLARSLRGAADPTGGLDLAAFEAALQRHAVAFPLPAPLGGGEEEEEEGGGGGEGSVVLDPAEARACFVRLGGTAGAAGAQHGQQGQEAQPAALRVLRGGGGEGRRGFRVSAAHVAEGLLPVLADSTRRLAQACFLRADRAATGSAPLGALLASLATGDGTDSGATGGSGSSSSSSSSIATARWVGDELVRAFAGLPGGCGGDDVVGVADFLTFVAHLATVLAPGGVPLEGLLRAVWGLGSGKDAAKEAAVAVAAAVAARPFAGKENSSWLAAPSSARDGGAMASLLSACDDATGSRASADKAARVRCGPPAVLHVRLPSGCTAHVPRGTAPPPPPPPPPTTAAAMAREAAAAAAASGGGEAGGGGGGGGAVVAGVRSRPARDPLRRPPPPPALWVAQAATPRGGGGDTVASAASDAGLSYHHHHHHHHQPSPEPSFYEPAGPQHQPQGAPHSGLEVATGLGAARDAKAERARAARRSEEAARLDEWQRNRSRGIRNAAVPVPPALSGSLSSSAAAAAAAAADSSNSGAASASVTTAFGALQAARAAEAAAAAAEAARAETARQAEAARRDAAIDELFDAAAAAKAQRGEEALRCWREAAGADLKARREAREAQQIAEAAADRRRGAIGDLASYSEGDGGGGGGGCHGGGCTVASLAQRPAVSEAAAQAAQAARTAWALEAAAQWEQQRRQRVDLPLGIAKQRPHGSTCGYVQDGGSSGGCGGGGSSGGDGCSGGGNGKDGVAPPPHPGEPAWLGRVVAGQASDAAARAELAGACLAEHERDYAAAEARRRWGADVGGEPSARHQPPPPPPPPPPPQSAGEALAWPNPRALAPPRPVQSAHLPRGHPNLPACLLDVAAAKALCVSLGRADLCAHLDGPQLIDDAAFARLLRWETHRPGDELRTVFGVESRRQARYLAQLLTLCHERGDVAAAVFARHDQHRPGNDPVERLAAGAEAAAAAGLASTRLTRW